MHISATNAAARRDSPSPSLPAVEVENLVVTAIADLPADSAALVERLGLAQLDTPSFIASWSRREPMASICGQLLIRRGGRS